MSADLIWPFLLVGLASGGLYTLLGAGVVLAYRASGYLHIAHAGVAMLSAISYVVLMRRTVLAVALPAALAVGVLTTWLLYRFVFARLADASMPAKVVVSVAAGIGLQALGGVLIINSGILRTSRASLSVFPETTRFTLFGASVSAQQLALPVIAVGTIVVMQWLLHHTDAGLALRASSQNPTSAELAGIPAARVTSVAWVGTGFLAGVAGVLSISSASFLVPTYLFAETIRGLAAALTGGFVDLRLTAVAGFSLGILESELVGVSPPWNEMRGAVSFALITAVALLGVGRQLASGERAEARA